MFKLYYERLVDKYFGEVKTFVWLPLIFMAQVSTDSVFTIIVHLSVRIFQ